jgi:hypothetical protein
MEALQPNRDVYLVYKYCRISRTVNYKTTSRFVSPAVIQCSRCPSQRNLFQSKAVSHSTSSDYLSRPGSIII